MLTLSIMLSGNHRRVLSAAVIGGSFALVYACSGTGSIGGSPVSDGSAPPSEAGGNPDSGAGATDSGTDAEGGEAVAVTNCTARVRVDTLGGVAGSNSNLEAEAFGNKYAVVWSQLAVVSPDGQDHVKARVFDGASFGTEIDLGTSSVSSGAAMRMASDRAGHAFLAWSGASNPMRTVFDFSTLGFDTPSTFALANPYSDDVAGGGPGVGLLLYLLGNGTFAADRWQADGGWQRTSLSVAASPDDTRLYSNAAGHAVASWRSGVGPIVSAAPYDGSAWGAVATISDSDGGSNDPAYAQYTVLSNGDALYMFAHSGEVRTSLFHAGTGTFDPPVTVATQPAVYQHVIDRHIVVADSMDRLTIAWVGPINNDIGHNFASRSFDRGAHWSAPADLGPSNFVSLAVGPSDEVVAATLGDGTSKGQGFGSPSDPGIALRAISPTGTTWSAPVLTNVQTGNVYVPSFSARVIFDASHHVIVVGPQATSTAGAAYTLQAVTCDL